MATNRYLIRVDPFFFNDFFSSNNSTCAVNWSTSKIHCHARQVLQIQRVQQNVKRLGSNTMGVQGSNSGGILPWPKEINCNICNFPLKIIRPPLMRQSKKDTDIFFLVFLYNQTKKKCEFLDSFQVKNTL